MSDSTAHGARWAALAALLCVAALAPGQQSRPSVVAVPEKTDVVVGESFLLELQVENVGEAEEPDLASLTEDFTVENLGGRRESSESIAMYNGRTTRVVSMRYRIIFRLTARREGRLEIPGMRFQAGGETLVTDPIAITATPPQPVEGFRLTTTLSKTECYVGEPVTLTTTYYIGGQVRDILFSLPVLEIPEVTSEPIEPVQQPNREYYQVPVNDKAVIAVKGEERVGDRDFITLSFQHVIVPREEGELVLSQSTVSAQAVVAQRRGRSPFDGGFFGSREQFKQVVSPADPVTLKILPVVEEGKPDDFSGLIGTFTISASASPTTVNVGDPITLTIVLDGSNHLHQFEFPPLRGQTELAAAFRIPEEMAPGRVEGNRKIFTQTIRALSSEVEAIPAIALSYFDTTSGAYAVARTSPIPITVKASQVVTASDAEGFQQRVETIEHVAVNEGIAHNFNDADALKARSFGPDMWLRSGASWALLLLPPLLWSGLAAGVLLRRSGGFKPRLSREKQARLDLDRALDSLGDQHDPGRALAALRAYLGGRLGLKASALTYADVADPLAAAGVGPETLGRAKALFDDCEALHYAGTAAGAGAELAHRIRAIAEEIEKETGR